MVWTRQKIVFAVGAAIVVTDLLVGALLVFGGGTARQTAATPAPTPSPQLRSPFTGEPVSSLHRVLAVKIDNTALGQPGRGRAEPAAGDLLVPFPSGGRAGAQRARG